VQEKTKAEMKQAKTCIQQGHGGAAQHVDKVYRANLEKQSLGTL